MASTDFPPISRGKNVLATISKVSRIMSSEIADLAIFPRSEDPLRVNHKPGVVGDSLAVECGLSQLTLTSPEISLARQQARAQRPPGLRHRAR